MKTKLIVTASISIFFLISSLSAQTQGQGSVLTWSDCVSLVRQNNPSLSSSRYAAQASRSSYRGSYNGIYPQVSLSHSYSNTSNSLSGSGGSSQWQTAGNASLNIFNQSQFSNIRISQALLNQSEANLRQASANVRFNLQKAFYQLVFAQKNIEVSKNIVEMRKDEAQLVSLRYDSGTEYKGNRLRAEAQFLQAQADLAQSIRDLRVSQRTLNQQLGMDDFVVLNVTSTLKIQEPGDLPKDERPLLDNRPDIILQEAIVFTSEASLKQSKSSMWPNLSANYSLVSQGSSEFSTSSPQSAYGATLSYPLFGQGPSATYYAVKTARNNLEKAKQDLRSVREQAIVDIETAWSNFSAAIDQSKVQLALLEAARTRNDEANIRYDSGLMTYDNWEIIASDRINQERQALQAELNEMIAQAAWENALGKQLEE